MRKRETQLLAPNPSLLLVLEEVAGIGRGVLGRPRPGEALNAGVSKRHQLCGHVIVTPGAQKHDPIGQRWVRELKR